MDTVPFLLCELGAPLFTNLKGAGTYFMCIPAMNRRMYKTLVDITSAGVFLCTRKFRWNSLVHKKALRANDAHSRDEEVCRKRPRSARECAKAHSYLLPCIRKKLPVAGSAGC